MEPNKPGHVIAIDGPDGVGKTTQLKLLADYLSQSGHAIHTARQSGGTPIGEELRKASLSPAERSAETDLYISLAMGQALAEDIHQRRSRGEMVLIDRSPLTFIAYNGYGSQLIDVSQAFAACEQLFKSEEIDQLIFLQAPQTVLNSRRQKRQALDYFEKKDNAYHERVASGYQAGLAFLQKHAELGAKLVTIDATGSIETIQKAILAAIEL